MAAFKLRSVHLNFSPISHWVRQREGTETLLPMMCNMSWGGFPSSPSHIEDQSEPWGLGDLRGGAGRVCGWGTKSQASSSHSLVLHAVCSP